MVTTCHITIEPFEVTGQMAFLSHTRISNTHIHMKSNKLSFTQI